MTKTKAKTAKTASKKPAAKKAASAKAKPAARKTAATKKSSTKKTDDELRAPKAAAVAARPAAGVSAAAKRRPKVVVEAHKPPAKPAADFGAGLASAPSHAAKPAAKPEAKSEAKAAPAAAPAAPVAVDASDTSEVATYLRNCDHARAADFGLVRKLILEASSSIEEGIKWNAPSFRTTEWFATFHLREPNKVAIVFHLGSTKRDNQKRVPVGAPEGMVEWLATDRCMVTVDDVKRRGKALQAFVRAWILHV